MNPIAAPAGTGEAPRRRMPAWLVDVLLVVGCLAADSSSMWRASAATSAGAVAVTFTLLLRRHRPGTVLAIQLGWALAVPWLEPGQSAVLAPLVALYAFAARRSLPWTIAGLCGFYATLAATAPHGEHRALPGEPTLTVSDIVAVAVITILLMVAVPAAVCVVAYRRPADDTVRLERDAANARYRAWTALHFPRLQRWHAVTRPAPDPMPPRSQLRRWLVDVPALWLVFGVDVVLMTGETRGAVPRWILVIVGIAVILSLLVRRRRPVAVFAVQAGWCAVLPPLLQDTPGMTLGMAVALYALAIRRPIRWALVAGAVDLAVIAWIVTWVTNYGPADARGYMRDTAIGVGVFAFVGVAVTLTVGRNVTAKRRAAASVQQALRHERVEIARELHDIVAHAVSIMVLQAAGAKAALTTDPRRAAEALDVIRDTGTQSLDELRRLLHLLRSATGGPAEATYPPISDFAGVDALIEQSRVAGLPVEVEVTGDPAVLDPSVSLAAYRLVQEALTNTRKHAGPRARASVRIAWTVQRLCLTVEDRSPERRAPARSTGVGLLGLGERVATVGGLFRAGHSTDGFVVEATLPARKRVASRDSGGWDALVSGRTGAAQAQPRPAG